MLGEEGSYVQELKECIAACERDDHVAGLAAFKRFPIGGMDTLADWQPDFVLPGETGNSAVATFGALLSQFCHLAALLEKYL